MEFNFSITRVLLFVALLAAFAVMGGFSPPIIPHDSVLDPTRVATAWRYCVLLFLVGAVSTSLVDHFVGTLDRSNLRLLYVVIGLALMTGAAVWLRGLKGMGHDDLKTANIGGSGNAAGALVAYQHSA